MENPRFDRSYKDRSVRPALYDLNARQKKINLSADLLEKSQYVRRTEFLDWNYDVELFALGARLKENFNSDLLREAFRSPTFYKVPNKTKIDINLKDSLPSNERLVEIGTNMISSSLNRFLKSVFPGVPAEGIEAFKVYLMSPKTLAFVSLHIGTKELVVSEEYPPCVQTLADALCAVFGAHIESGNDIESTDKLVRDLLAVQLSGVDLHDIWKISDPLLVLSKILSAEGKGEPEPRLLWISGKNTLLASYHVGIYSNKILIGECTGESIDIAKMMAATDALRRIYMTDSSKSPIPFRSANQSSLLSAES